MQATERKIIITFKTNKGLIPRIHREVLQINKMVHVIEK